MVLGGVLLLLHSRWSYVLGGYLSGLTVKEGLENNISQGFI